MHGKVNFSRKRFPGHSLLITYQSTYQSFHWPGLRSTGVFKQNPKHSLGWFSEVPSAQVGRIPG